MFWIHCRRGRRVLEHDGIEDEGDEILEWEIYTYPILDNEGQVVQAIVLEQDITEKSRLELTLAQSEKLAAMGQWAASLAHEINNPLDGNYRQCADAQTRDPAGGRQARAG